MKWTMSFKDIFDTLKADNSRGNFYTHKHVDDQVNTLAYMAPKWLKVVDLGKKGIFIKLNKGISPNQVRQFVS